MKYTILNPSHFIIALPSKPKNRIQDGDVASSNEIVNAKKKGSIADANAEEVNKPKGKSEMSKQTPFLSFINILF